MNKRGQVLILKIMLAVVMLIFAIGFSGPIRENIENVVNTTNLNCSSNSLSYSMNATCTVVEFMLFYLIGGLISVGMAFIAGSKNASGIITAITIFVITTVLINPLKDLIIAWRGASYLNCSGTISVANKLLCILADAWLFWFIAIALSATVTYIFVKLRKELISKVPIKRSLLRLITEIFPDVVPAYTLTVLLSDEEYVCTISLLDTFEDASPKFHFIIPTPIGVMLE